MTNELQTVGAMHQCRAGESYSTCVHCGALAEALNKPCPHFMRDAAQKLAAVASPTPQADSQPAMTPETVYAAIAHGDEEHRAWLLSALRAVWCGEAVPPVASPIANAAADSQPAPVEVVDAMADSQYLAGVSAGWNAANADDPNSALQKLHESRAGYLKPLSAPKPSPTPQADSQPVLLKHCLELLNSFDYEDDEDSQSKAFFTAHINVDWFFHVKDLLERAARAPADSVTAPAGGGVTGPSRWTVEEILDGNRGIRWVTEGVIHGRPTDHDVREYLMRTPAMRGCYCDDCKAFYARTSPDQAADSVLEDAARWFAERDNVLQSFWVLLGEAEAHADNDNNPLLKHQVEGFYRQWNALNGTTLGPRWVTRAARKQGGAT